MIHRALVLAAGRGERLRPLTDTTPKPLIPVGGKRLVDWHLDRLAAAGIVDVVINTAHLAAQFEPALGDGRERGLRIRYSHEGDEPLETGGGMLHALARFEGEPFLVVNADVWTDVDVAALPAPRALAHLVLVDNPAHHPRGDFVLRDDGRVVDGEADEARLTYSGIATYHPALFSRWREDLAAQGHPWDGREPPRFALVHLLRAAIARGEVEGVHHRGAWTDVGTPQRLAELEADLRVRAGR